MTHMLLVIARFDGAVPFGFTVTNCEGCDRPCISDLVEEHKFRQDAVQRSLIPLVLCSECALPHVRNKVAACDPITLFVPAKYADAGRDFMERVQRSVGESN